MFCTNYCFSRAGLTPCRNAWHGGCFTADPDEPFPYARAEDEEGFTWHKNPLDLLRYKYLADGTHLMIPFQCPDCHFMNLNHGRRPGGSPFDSANLKFIHRAMLDSGGGREHSTILNHLREVRRLIKKCRAINKPITFPSLGPFPVEDVLGIGPAMDVLMQSLDKGRNLAFVQFDTFRKARSCYSSLYRASWRRALEGASIESDPRKKFTLTQCLTQTVWFERFMRGVELQVGRVAHPDQAISIEIMLEMMKDMEMKVRKLARGARRRALVKQGAYFLICFVGSLRGNEGFLADAASLRRHIGKGRHGRLEHVIVPLLGRFKGETGEKYHLLALVNRTFSGLRVRWWVEQLVLVLAEQGQMNGPTFCDEQGNVASSAGYQRVFVEFLRRVQRRKPDLIPSEVNVGEEYSIGRSFRRGSETRALNAKVPEPIINAINRWKVVEGAKGARPRFNMLAHYADVLLMLETILQYSAAL